MKFPTAWADMEDEVNEMLINRGHKIALLTVPGLALMLLTSCATSELRVESNPDGAEVTIMDSTKSVRRIGVTPIVLNQLNAFGLFKSPMHLNVSKEGYKSQSVFLPETNVAASGQLVVQLKSDDAGFINNATQQVAQVQRMIFKKNYGEAERLLIEAIAKNPSVVVFHSLLGNVYYLQKNTSRALDSYQRAQALEPNNIEVAKMIQKLKGFRFEEAR